MSTDNNEISQKLNRLGEFLGRHQLDGVFLNHRSNFAWITGGKDNHVASATPNGVAGILATPTSRICFTSSIEAPRYSTEELVDNGIEVVWVPWYDHQAAQNKLKELIAGRKSAADVTDGGDFDRYGAGFQRLPNEFAELRWKLTDAEIARYREGGKRTSSAIESACRRITRNMTEHEIAGVLDNQVRASGMIPVVTLVAADGRVEKYRHPIPTEQRVTRYCMIVTCAWFQGLISNVTRVVSFVPLSQLLRQKQQAVCNVDAAINLSTTPGRTLGEMFSILEKAYEVNGFPGEQGNHHQGGSTGYMGREAFATPGNGTVILENQAFAWNPSIAGVKSEDTMLCTAKGPEFLTSPSVEWPKITAEFGEKTLQRADILVR